MHTPLSTRRDAGRPAPGMALVIVLASLVFLTALVLAFLSSVGTELKSSKSYADGVSVRLLAQSAANLVMGEIGDATKGTDAAGLPLCWASQPGMIRTYDSDGKPLRYFKLYSDEEMSGAGAYAVASDLPPADWRSQKAIYTDLNHPVTVNGVDNYPIIDGNNLTDIGGKQMYDSDKDGIPDVEGFSIGSVPGSGAGTNPAPMPVKWLYVLANGEVVAPQGSGNIATVAGADKSPIVGRIAFWTDDETCKININTASEGYYWDMPRTSSTFDGVNLARYQPSQHEYQRYPGHPAMTSLSTVFSKLTAEQIYNIIPRVVGGEDSSKGGTKKGSAVLNADSDRLYATVDELLFKPTLQNGERQTNASPIDKPALETAKFFVTASSRAPDLNLFGKPRISIWPIYKNEDPSRTTPFDRLIAFCSKVNKHIYYFQREDPGSQTNDLPLNGSATGLGRNRMVLEYLRDLTSQNIPGFGGNFLAKYPSPGGSLPSDRDQILTQMFDYIRSANLTDLSTPGLIPFTPVGTSKQTITGTAQVVPIHDDKTGTRGFGRFPTIRGGTIVFYGTANDQPNPTAPAGATPWPSKPDPMPPAGQITIRAFFIPQLFNPSLGYPFVGPRYYIRVSGLENFRWTGVDAAGAATSPQGLGFPLGAGGVNGVIKMFNNGIDNMWGDHPLGGMPGDMQVLKKSWSNLTLTDGFPLGSSRINQKKDGTFEFTGGEIKIEMLAPAPAPDDGNLAKATVVQTVSLRFPNGTFPVPQEAPVRCWPSPPSGSTTYWDYRRLTRSTSPNPRAGSNGNEYDVAHFINSTDVVRSVVPAVGDARLMAARSVIKTNDPAYDTLFKEHSKYASSSQFAHSLRNGQNSPFYGATGGRLLPLNYAGYSAVFTQTKDNMNNLIPVDCGLVPDSFTNGVTIGKTSNAQAGDPPGDWDNGVCYKPDGPYINMPDEGDYQNSTSGGVQTPYFGWNRTPVSATLFSPNRMMPSAGMFGSLPSQVWANKPWQTLLFRAGPSGHKGLESPKDHLFLDLFNMPVVEPYAISEPLSTGGRINMNYQIVPFNYITRETGVRAILKSEKVIAIPDSMAASYKKAYSPSNSGTTVRFDVKINETLKGFQDRFNSGDIFRSASEICDIHIVPNDNVQYENMEDYWMKHRLTGDNSRERPYATIYPRLTTKSNTFTIHMRVQALKKVKGTEPAQWVEGIDQITGEYRGSQLVERYIDPNDAVDPSKPQDIAIPDYANLSDPNAAKPLSQFYKFRVVNSKQFCP